LNEEEQQGCGAKLFICHSRELSLPF